MRNPLECLLCLCFMTTLFASACQSVSVPEWPYVKEAAEAGVAANGATGDASTDGGANTSSTETPVACDGALCDTTNYAACNIVDSPADSRAARSISLLLVVAAVTLTRRRTRRKKERTL
jgi:hypothetical protein